MSVRFWLYIRSAVVYIGERMHATEQNDTKPYCGGEQRNERREDETKKEEEKKIAI